jgi:hypothetical protein
MPCFQGSSRNRNPAGYYRRIGLQFFGIGLAIILLFAAVAAVAFWLHPRIGFQLLPYSFLVLFGCLPLMGAGAWMAITGRRR